MHSWHLTRFCLAQIEFDESDVSYRDLVQIHMMTHDPTSLDRQGYDVGSMYRSVIFYHSPHQRQVAEEFLAELISTGVYAAQIVTQIREADTFYPAEEKFQSYFLKHSETPYCQLVIKPKLKALERHLQSKSRDDQES